MTFTPQQLHLLTVHFQAENSEQYCFCSGIAPTAFENLLAKAFAHSIFQSMTMDSQSSLLMHHLSDQLLSQAGVALSNKKPMEIKCELYVDKQLEQESSSYWLRLNLAGRMGIRKNKVIESTLTDWLQLLFKDHAVLLPKARIVPPQDAPDLLALRLGWRFEAQQRLYESYEFNSSNE